ncbi:hypothetical protein RvY_10269 [Ramazzottius varieornatus]|uniref:Peroxin-19 n=1 Tax=Ramazzottius varieornatus TaxID=947166 RepID=A0A1D1VHL2_RAMVA|nr:hypothetical protein RvY_10269 [Ramazzottius varieornatus]
MAPGEPVDPDLVGLVFRCFAQNNRNYSAVRRLVGKSYKWVQNIIVNYDEATKKRKVAKPKGRPRATTTEQDADLLGFIQANRELSGAKLASLRTFTRRFLSKDLMYEPVKECELELKQWLEEKRETLAPEVAKRHEAQLCCLRSLVREYEVNWDGMNSENEDVHLPKLLELAKQLQDTGEFPEGIRSYANLEDVYGGVVGGKKSTEKDHDLENAPPNCATS